ncbi:MAG: tetratricopeptide repeat protein [Candidatus Thorarchaeota archaeon]
MIHSQDGTKGEYEVKFNGKSVGKRKIEGDFIDTINLGFLETSRFSVEIFWNKKQGGWQSTLFVTDDYPECRVPKRSTEEENLMQFIDLAEDLIEAERMVEAKNILEKIKRANPDITRVHSLWGRVYEEQNEPKWAKIAYEAALRIDPNDLFSLRQLGSIFLFVERNLEEAIPYLERSVNASKGEDNHGFLYLILLIMTLLILERDEDAKGILDSCQGEAVEKSWSDAVEFLEKFLEFSKKGKSGEIKTEKGSAFIARVLGEAIDNIGRGIRIQHLDDVKKLKSLYRRFMEYHKLMG